MFYESAMSTPLPLFLNNILTLHFLYIFEYKIQLVHVLGYACIVPIRQ